MIQHTSSKVGLIWTLTPCCVVVTRPGDFAEKDKAKNEEQTNIARGKINYLFEPEAAPTRHLNNHMIETSQRVIRSSGLMYSNLFEPFQINKKYNLLMNLKVSFFR